MCVHVDKYVYIYIHTTIFHISLLLYKKMFGTSRFDHLTIIDHLSIYESMSQAYHHHSSTSYQLINRTPDARLYAPHRPSQRLGGGRRNACSPQVEADHGSMCFGSKLVRNSYSVNHGWLSFELLQWRSGMDKLQLNYSYVVIFSVIY